MPTSELRQIPAASPQSIDNSPKKNRCRPKIDRLQALALMIASSMRTLCLQAVALAVVVMAMASPHTAFASTTDVSFGDGSLTGLSVDAGFSQGSIQNLSYSHTDCGTEPAEATCIWDLRMTLYSDPARRCLAGTPESQLLWDSGERPGNGTVESGPLSFALEGCRGQILSVFYEEKKTFNPEEEEGPWWKVLSSSWSATLLLLEIGAESVEEIERRIREASPAAHPTLPPLPLTLAVSANCRSLKIGSTRYSFAFRQMGCRKATNLAEMFHVSRGAPSGYVCKALQGEGERCWRRQRAEKYVEWHLPSRAPRQAG
jgi:hypothetical protein